MFNTFCMDVNLLDLYGAGCEYYLVKDLLTSSERSNLYTFIWYSYCDIILPVLN